MTCGFAASPYAPVQAAGTHGAQRRPSAGTLVPDFVDSESWHDFSPRAGFQWTPVERSQLYGFWAKGFRSGGYNFRNTDPGVAPGPFGSPSAEGSGEGVRVLDVAQVLEQSIQAREPAGGQDERKFSQ